MNTRPISVAAFGAATLAPLPLLAMGAFFGGGWLWAALFYMTVLVVLIDQIMPGPAANAPEGAEFPGSDRVLAAVGLSHLALLPLTVWAVAGGSGLSGLERALTFLAAGYWIGQVAHPAAHELIHRGNRWLFRLGVAVYTSLLYGHHSSAHRLVHHRHVATPDDPSSAPAGMGFWRFAPRAWIGSFRAGLAAESALRARAARPGLHPYAAYVAGAIASLALAAVLGGPWGVLAWLGLCAHAQLQLLLADYVQHYGLQRKRIDDRYEPVGTRHSWNTPQWFSSALMLNAPRHSDHHAHPSRPYAALRLEDDAPMLPWPLPVACTLALSPRLWRRAMRGPLARWSQAGPG